MADRISAHNIGGAVVITCDPDSARDLAEAFSAAYATCADLEADRPRWFSDVVAIVTAAARADEHAGRVPPPVQVPLVRQPTLRLVSGGDA